MSDNGFWELVGEMYELRSFYAQRWLSLLVYNNGTVAGMSISAIRSVMCVNDDDYKQKSDLIKKVVYLPIDEVNLKTMYRIGYTYLADSRRPILGFNFNLTRKKGNRPILNDLGADLLMNIKEEYNIPSGIFLHASKHPIVVARLFQAHHGINVEDILIQFSSNLYMNKVVENTMNYLEPIIGYKKY